MTRLAIDFDAVTTLANGINDGFIAIEHFTHLIKVSHIQLGTQFDVATAMAKAIPNAELLMPDAGHVGMIVGSQAKNTVWNPVSEFFLKNL